MVTRPDFNSLPDFYKNYVLYVQDSDVWGALRQSGDVTQAFLKSIPSDKQDFRYADGKWSIREVIVHVMDAERVFAYRALRFARNDQTELPGFEQNDWVPESNAHSRSIGNLADEMKRLRSTTIDLFESFTSEMLSRKGAANKSVISVLNLGYVIAGHETHHRTILMDRYVNNFS